MVAYLQQIRLFGRDIRLFLLYNLLIYVGLGVFILIYNLYLVGLGLREDFIGLFQSVQTLAMAAAALTMGPVLRRYGVWRGLVGSAALFLTMLLALALVSIPSVLLVLSAIMGVAMAYVFTATMPFIIEWGRRESRAQIAAISFSLISLATTFGSLVGGFVPALVGRLIDAGSQSVPAYRWTLVIGTLVGALALIPLFLMDEPRRVKTRVDTTQSQKPETAADKRQVRMDMGVFITVGGIMAIGAGMVFPFYNVFLVSLGANSTQVGFVYAAGGAVAAVIGLAAPAVSARVGSLKAVLWVRLAIVPFYLLLIVNPIFAAAVIAHLVRQTSISMGWPLDSTFVSEILPARARASVFGFRSASWNLMFSAGSLFAGWIIVRAGYNWTFAALVVSTIVAMGLYYGYYGRHPLVRAGEIPSALSPKQRARIALAQQAIAERAAEEMKGADDDATVAAPTTLPTHETATLGNPAIASAPKTGPADETRADVGARNVPETIA